MPSKTDINPATGKMWAVNPATGVWDDNYWANVVEPQLRAQFGGGGGGGDRGTANEFIKALVEPILKELQGVEQRMKDFGLEGAFAFDEALAKQTSTEEVNPFYEAELGEFLEGVQMRKRQGLQEERRLLDELTTEREFETGQLRRKIEDSILDTEESFERAGLFQSGLRRREAGRIEAIGGEGLARAEQLFGEEERRIAEVQRQREEQLGFTEKVGRRDIAQDRTADILGRVETRRKEAQAKTELERTQTAALPFIKRSEEALQRTLQLIS